MYISVTVTHAQERSTDAITRAGKNSDAVVAAAEKNKNVGGEVQKLDVKGG